MSSFKKLINSKAFKILSLAVPSLYFGRFTLIGAIKTATAFDSTIINAPQTISRYSTAIRTIYQGIKQAAPVKKLAKSANANPQVVLESMRKLTKYGIPSVRTIARVNPNPRIGIDISVNDYVNSKMESINQKLP